jgi:hypothetical protein
LRTWRLGAITERAIPHKAAKVGRRENLKRIHHIERRERKKIFVTFAFFAVALRKTLTRAKAQRAPR